MQNKIDRLIINGNTEFSENRNVVLALIEYSRSLDIFEYIDRSYKIQYHELLVRIAICYDILGNFNKTLENLEKAMKIVPNISSLVLYKSVLLQTLGRSEEAQKVLIKYKQISQKKMDLYETFRLVFYFTMRLEKEVILREINEYFDKYPKNAVVLYLRAMTYLEFSNDNIQDHLNPKKSEFYSRYENDIREASALEPHDTEFLLKDGITLDNLTKLFFMILPDMDFYQPKALANYKTFHSGLRIFYIIFKAIKLLKIKVEKKKIKNFYSMKLKQFKKKIENSRVLNENSDNSNSIVKDQSELPNQYEVSAISGISGTATNTNKESNYTNNNSDFEIKELSDLNTNQNITRSSKINSGLLKSKVTRSVTSERTCNNAMQNCGTKKNPTIVKIKNNFEKANADEIINEIKKEYEIKIKSLFKSVWLYNIKLCENIKYDTQADIDTNYFIKNKYYAPFNLKENLIYGVHQNMEYKSNHPTQIKNLENDITTEKHKFSRQVFKINELNENSNKTRCYDIPEEAPNFSLSEINQKFVGNETIMSDIDLLENKEKNKFLNIGSLKKIESEKFKFNQKIPSEVIKTEMNSRRFLHKPSPRTNTFKFNFNNKFISYSKDKRNELELNENLFSKNNDVLKENKDKSNYNNVTSNSTTTINKSDPHANNANNINVFNIKSNQENMKNTGESNNYQYTLRKNLNSANNKPIKNERNEILSSPPMTINKLDTKPLILKNVNKLSNKLNAYVISRFKRSESHKAGGGMKTHEN